MKLGSVYLKNQSRTAGYKLYKMGGVTPEIIPYIQTYKADQPNLTYNKHRAAPLLKIISLFVRNYIFPCCGIGSPFE
jgi:hypothetical protein